jgi:chromosome segregation ATPase
MDARLEGAVRRVDALSREIHLKEEEIGNLQDECRRLRAELFEASRKLVEEEKRREAARERMRELETRVEMRGREMKRTERMCKARITKREGELENMLRAKPLTVIKEKNVELREARAENEKMAAVLKRVAERTGLQLEGIFEVLPACESADDPLILRMLDDSFELWKCR